MCGWVYLSVFVCIFVSLFASMSLSLFSLDVCAAHWRPFFDVFVSWRYVQYALGFEDCHSHTVNFFLFRVELRAMRSPT